MGIYIYIYNNNGVVARIGEDSCDLLLLFFNNRSNIFCTKMISLFYKITTTTTKHIHPPPPPPPPVPNGQFSPAVYFFNQCVPPCLWINSVCDPKKKTAQGIPFLYGRVLDVCKAIWSLFFFFYFVIIIIIVFIIIQVHETIFNFHLLIV